LNTSVYAVLSMWRAIFHFHTLMFFDDKELCNCRMWQTPAWDRHEQTYNFHTCSSPRIATSLHGLKHILKQANAVSCFVFENFVLKPAVVTGIQFSSVSPGNCWDITL
jgi:hypothetical protein